MENKPSTFVCQAVELTTDIITLRVKTYAAEHELTELSVDTVLDIIESVKRLSNGNV